MTSNKATARDVAEYMARKFHQAGELLQADIVDEIDRVFGSGFVYENENGSPAIDKKVLAEFRKLTPDAIWERSDKFWRKRDRGDDPNSRAW